MFETLIRWLHRGNLSKDTARIRLQHILVIDRTGVAPEILEALRDDMLEIISKYFEIKSEDLKMQLKSDEDSMALVANIPVIKIKRQLKQRPVISEISE